MAVGCSVFGTGLERTEQIWLSLPLFSSQAVRLLGVKRALEIAFRDQRVQGSVETKFTPGETLEKSFGKQGESWSSLCLVTGFWNTGSLPVSRVNRTFCFLKIGR